MARFLHHGWLLLGKFVDNLARRAQRQIAASTRGWLVGGPPEEVALLNRLTERLGGNRSCQVAGSPPGVVESRSLTLHRRGTGGTDLFGADLAVSLHVQGTHFLKTALLQLKRAEKGRGRIESRQLGQMLLAYPFVQHGMFVAAADKDDGAMAIGPVENVVAGIRSARSLTLPKEVDFRVSDPGWLSSRAWARRWLGCEVGPRSRVGALSSIEALLWSYTRVEDAPSWVARQMSENLLQYVGDLPEGWVPARSWKIFEISHEAWEEGAVEYSDQVPDPRRPTIDPETLDELRRLL